jgi:hypothetical protein
MPMLPDLLNGRFSHFKGGLYLPLGYANDQNTEGRTVVVYTAPDAIRTAQSDDPEVAAWWDYVHEDGTKCLAHLGQICEHLQLESADPRFFYEG